MDGGIDMTGYILPVLPLLLGWLLDLVIGDPSWLPHPVVAFGHVIAACERQLNHGRARFVKGAVTACGLMATTYFITWEVLYLIDLHKWIWLDVGVQTVLIFFCLAGATLVREVRSVFLAADRSLGEGRKRVARIVGRDTQQLSDQEVRTAALETLAENLSDGVIAPLFWYALLGIPGMMAYKMVNTLDSMIGYRNERYRRFGCFAAHLDDIANYLPARLTALLMVFVSRRWSLLKFVYKFGSQHTSPNSGYPEAALAGILDCRFGGSHNYFGEEVWKPYIGTNLRTLTSADMKTAIRINRRTETVMILLTMAVNLATIVVSV